MILVDTSVWVDYLRSGNTELATLLQKAEVLTHPFVIGELSLGNLKSRKDILALLRELPQASVAEHEEVMDLVNTRKIMGQGVGWVDSHLLASALITGSPLWTADRKLRLLCASLGVLY